MKKIILIYGHYNDKSFNAAIRDTFVNTVKEKGHSVDVIDLYKEKFNPVFAGEEPDNTVLNHRKKIESSDAIVLIAPIWNFRMPAIVEGWIDKVLAPPWAFRFKRLFKLQLPYALPFILTGMKTSIGLALIGAVVAEFVAGSGTSTGLAWRIIEAGNRLDVPKLFAALILLVVLGIILFLLMSLIEKLLLKRWDFDKN